MLTFVWCVCAFLLLHGCFFGYLPSHMTRPASSGFAASDRGELGCMYVVCMNVQVLVAIIRSLSILSILSLCARSVLVNLARIHVTVSTAYPSELLISIRSLSRRLPHPPPKAHDIQRSQSKKTTTALGTSALFSKCPSSLTIVYIRVLDASCNRIDRDAAVSG